MFNFVEIVNGEANFMRICLTNLDSNVTRRMESASLSVHARFCPSLGSLCCYFVLITLAKLVMFHQLSVARRQNSSTCCFGVHMTPC